MSGSNNQPLIGLKGERRAGKDTIAGILVRDHGYTRRAFADNLKREVYDAFGHLIMASRGESYGFDSWMPFLDEHKNDPADSEFGWVGPLLQFWGTEYRRQKCGETYWLDQLETQLGPGVVVTDIRFPNEADLIRKHGGYIIHVDRRQGEDDGAARGNSHASESLVASIPSDCTVTNDSTFEDLETEIADLVPFLASLIEYQEVEDVLV